MSGILSQHQALLAAGRFMIQHCKSCDKHIYFPREVCPHCGSDAVRFVEPKGTGTVYATTTVRRKADAGGDINVSLIDLIEGVRIMSRIANLKPDDVKIGQRVKARVEVKETQGQVVFDVIKDDAI